MAQKQLSLDLQTQDADILVAEAIERIEGEWARQTRATRVFLWIFIGLWLVDELYVFATQGSFRWMGASLVCTYFVIQLARTWVAAPSVRVRELLKVLASKSYVLDELPELLRLMARVPNTSDKYIVASCATLTTELTKRLPLISETQAQLLGPEERAYLRVWAETGTPDQKVAAFLVLAFARDELLLPLAKLSAANDIDPRVREAASDFLRSMWEL